MSSINTLSGEATKATTGNNLTIDELKNRPIWCVAGQDKSPLTFNGQRASTTNPEHWMSFTNAREAAEQLSKKHNYKFGVGLMAQKGSGIVLIDFDIKDKNSKQWNKKTNQFEPAPKKKWTHKLDLILAERYANYSHTYTELSQSGLGFHMIGLGELPDKGKNTALIEIYDDARFFIFTGNEITYITYELNEDVVSIHTETNEYREIKPIQNLANELLNVISTGKRRVGYYSTQHVIGNDIIDVGWVHNLVKRKFQQNNPRTNEANEITLTDDEVWHRVKKGRTTAGKIEQFNVLSDTESGWKQYDEYESQSDADHAMLGWIYFISKDHEQTRRLFRQTALGKREKAERDGYLNYSLDQFSIKNNSPNQYHTKSNEHRLKNHENIGSQNKFEVVSTDSLLNSEFPKWLVKGIVPNEGLIAFFGPTGSGKSFTVFELLSCISSQRDFFGHKCRYAPTALVYFEGAAGIPQRVKAYNQIHGRPDITFIRATAADLSKDTDVELLINTLSSQMEQAGVICIDTLAASFPGMEENSSTDMGRLVSNLQKIQSRLGGVVIVIHHTGKDVTKGLRGHSSLKAALDGAIEIKTEIGHMRQLYVDKVRDGQDGERQEFYLESVFLGLDEDNEQITSCVVREKKDHPLKLKTRELEIKKANETKILILEWMNEADRLGEKPSGRYLENLRKQTDDIDLTQKELRTILLSMEEENMIKKSGTKSRPFFIIPNNKP